jgi:RND superfamily putative drug exporter
VAGARSAVGGSIAWIPLFLFAVLFGLSMDYHVFVVSRVREVAGRGMPTKQAVGFGISRSAGPGQLVAGTNWTGRRNPN